MKNNVNKICNFFSLAFLILMLASCSDIMNVQNTAPLDGSLGVVRISVGPGESVSDENSGSSEYASAQPRTFVPTSATARYTFKFTAQPVITGQEKIIEFTNKTLVNDEFEATLETGEWIVEVIRYEVAGSDVYPVAKGSSISFSVVPGDNDGVEVEINPIEGGAGRFTYTVSVASPINAVGSLELRRIGGNTNFVVPLALNGNTAGGTLYDIPSGNYDVIVSLTSDGKGTGKHSAAIIYPGLETKVSPTGFFNFTSSNFVQYINLAGYLYFDPLCTVIKPDPSASENVTVTAHNPVTGAIISGIVCDPIKWVDNSHTSAQEWKILHIPAANRSLDLRVTIQGSDGKTYITEKALALNNIPDEGKYDISVPAGIYSINTSSLSGGSVSVKVLGDDRTYASPGEKVNIGDTSTYGIKNGTLKYTYGANTITIPDTDRSFIMPAANVTLNATFFSADLTGVGVNITPSSGVVWDPAFDADELNYDITVPNSTSAVQIDPVKKDTDVSVAVAVTSGSITNISTNSASPTVVKITVTPPPGLGGKGSKTYTLNITREKSDVCTLVGLTVDPGTLVYKPSIKTYNVSVSYTEGNDGINVYAIQSDSNSNVKYYKYNSSLNEDEIVTNPISLDPGTNKITVKVTAEDNVNSENYIIMVTRNPALSTDNTLSEIVLKDQSGATTIETITVSTGVYLYIAADVPNTTAKVTIIATKNDAGATVHGDGIYDLGEGLNTVNILVISESGTSQPYTLKITRLP